jgi:hypothetical protein
VCDFRLSYYPGLVHEGHQSFLDVIIPLLPSCLLILSVPIALLGVVLSRVNFNEYGLLGGLNWMYYVGLGFALVALGVESMSKKPRKSIMWLTVLLSQIYIWVLPELTFSGLVMPAANHDLVFYPDTFSIVMHSHITAEQQLYQSWPGPYILGAILKLIFQSSSYIQLFDLMPIIDNMAVSILLYCFLSNYLGAGYSILAFIGISVFGVFNFTETLTTLTPFSSSYVLFYACTLILLILILRNGSSNKKTILIILIFFTSLSISHPEVGLAAVLAVTASFIPDALKRKAMMKLPFLLLFLGLALISLWASIAAISYLRGYTLGIFLNHLFNVFGSVSEITTAVASTSKLHELLNNLRLWVVIFMVGGALPALFKGNVRKDVNYQRIFCYAMGIGIAATIAGNIQTIGYPVRVFAYLLPVIIFLDLVSLSFLSRKTLIVVLVLVLAALSPISVALVYGNMPSEAVPDSSIQASIYYDTYAAIQSSNGWNTILEGQYVGFYGQNLNILYPYSQRVYFGVRFPSQPSDNFIVLGRVTQVEQQFLTGNGIMIDAASLDLNSQQDYYLIYNSGLMTIYYGS